MREKVLAFLPGKIFSALPRADAGEIVRITIYPYEDERENMK